MVMKKGSIVGDRVDVIHVCHALMGFKMGTKKESTAEEQEDAPNVFLIRSITIFQVTNLTHMTTKTMVVSWSYELVIHFKIASLEYDVF